MKMLNGALLYFIIGALSFSFSCDSNKSAAIEPGNSSDTTSDTTVTVPPKNDKSDFVLWQLQIQANTIGNSYVFRMNDGKVVVMDGGFPEEAPHLRTFLDGLGDKVEAWFVSHPHPDHVGALNEILKDPQGIQIKTIYHSRINPAFYHSGSTEADFYNSLAKAKAAGIQVVNITKPGDTITIDKTHFMILSVANPEITVNAINNSSMVIRVWDAEKSMVFLGDLGAEGGEKLLKTSYKNDLSCDYLQMAHHGQQGVNDTFYKSFKFSACLWPTPSWLWNNDTGKGYNTGPYKTIHTRNIMNSLGITRNYVSWKGLCKIEQ